MQFEVSLGEIRGQQLHKCELLIQRGFGNFDSCLSVSTVKIDIGWEAVPFRHKVNTGRREQEVCQLRWDWEVKLPELETSVFVYPSNDQFQTKNSQERVVVLNSNARRVVDERRGKHPEFVFTYKGVYLFNMLSSAQLGGGRGTGRSCLGFECTTFAIRSGTG